MSHICNITQQNALIDWARSTPWPRPIAVTLTLKQGLALGLGRWERIDRGKARGAIVYFCHELDRRCYPKIDGKRSGKVKRLVVLEGNDTTRWHYHLLIDCPAHVPPAIFAAWIYEIWNKVIWGYNEIEIKLADMGWLDYILKRNTKADYSTCVELDACHGLSD